MTKWISIKIGLMSAILLIAAMVAPTMHAAGQTNCEESYSNARKEFAIGNFPAVRALLAPCELQTAKGNITEINRIRELLALTAIAEDSLQRARKYICDIIQVD